METILILLAVTGTVLAILALIGIVAAKRRRLPYRRRDYLLTAAERSFCGVLRQVAGDGYHIAWKVRMADLIWIPAGASDRQRHLNRILAKHLDFVLCDPESSAPLSAIELDDSSHQEANRRRRDAFVDAALSAAGLPLLRVPARRSYVASELAQLVRSHLDP